ncbi:MAG: hypothetical protein A2Y62_09065 [Candidatus Fischerbacteria bacterium RBG_13_37_8]|uniref:Aspartate kinase n=1 Tax=Candidatus Fischerbacteria bacterium RBG_13_37_8 TaxID=1817863 RepID=A0A1F5VUM7_9BACT|nr:MAG: hypothetical protein A2Y62_09065 [Candidatus Fischerbacteria bacterium RBG_13_37_8]
MITVSEMIQKIVLNTPFLEEGLACGIINLSALARQIQPQMEKELIKPVSTNAIIMDLKRFSLKIPKTSPQQFQILKKINDISIRSNLTEYTFLHSGTILEKQKLLLHEIVEQRDKFITFTHGLYEVTIIVNSCLEKIVDKVFRKEKLIAKLSDLSALIIHLPDETVHTPGIFYLLMKQLAWENINVIEEVSTYTEFTIILDKANIDRAFTVLKNFLWKT